MKINLLSKIKKWFYDDILTKYLNEFHPTFFSMLRDDKPKFDLKNDKIEKEYKRILNILKSQKFKRMFYKIVEYKINETEPVKHGDDLLGKIKKFIAKQYLRLFNNELYANILKFEKISRGFNILNTNANDYINETTLDERAERAVVFGVGSRENSDAHIRMRNISNMRIAAIHKKNNS